MLNEQIFRQGVVCPQLGVFLSSCGIFVAIGVSPMQTRYREGRMAQCRDKMMFPVS